VHSLNVASALTASRHIYNTRFLNSTTAATTTTTTTTTNNQQQQHTNNINVRLMSTTVG
jgi:hypothetical protein